MNIESSDKFNNEVDILGLIGVVLKQKKTLFKFVFVFVFIGVFIAVFTKNEYESSVTIVPQVSNKSSMSGLGGLAAMAGINIGSSDGSSDVSPKLYEKITSSVPFRRALLESLIQVNGHSEKITFKDYYLNYNKPGVLFYIKKYTIGLPGVLISAIKGKDHVATKKYNHLDGIYRVSKLEDDLFENINKNLSLEVNDEDGIVKVNFTMPEALASAQMVMATQELLNKAIIEFKTEKINSDYEFIECTYNESKADFIKKQLLLADYRDRHQGLILSRSKSRLERLEAEYNLSYNLYSELSKQLSSQKIKLKENTPIFTVLEPVSVPLHETKPKRMMIIAIWLILGGVLGVGFILAKDFIENFKNR